MNNNQNPLSEDIFRDHIGTVNEDGKRNWLYPIKPKGKYYNARNWVTIFYLIVLFGLPFIKIDGHPFMLLNLMERKFILFGQIFWPQDFFIFALAMITMVVSIVLFTVAFGRIFCGWVCPQTIFMEMVFRKIEYLFEGDSMKQRNLTKSSWSWNKITRRGGKNIVFYLISFIISNTFLAYIIGIDELYKIITEPVTMHMAGFTSIIIFSLIFFFVFAWFREQVCIIVCPYGRLQGVMLDKDSVVVAYDYKRGEPREKIRKNEERTAGDCVDCKQCVRVCPTGIDIRHGTQLECVNCTACIDACDDIMEKVNLPKGLIRYASENNISTGKPQKFTKRMKAYSIVLFLLTGLLVVLLATRKDIETNILKTRGTVYQKIDKTHFANMYDVTFINKTYKSKKLTLKVEEFDAEIKMIGDNSLVSAESKTNGRFLLIINKNKLTESKTTVKLAVYEGDKKIETIKTHFYIPEFLN